MNIILQILFVIDAIVYLMTILDAFSKGEFKLIRNRQKELTDRSNEEIMNEISIEAKVINKVSMAIGYLLALVFVFLIYTSIISVPIILWINFNFVTALFGYVVTNLILSIFVFMNKVKNNGIDKMNENQPIFLILSNMFRILLLFIIYFGWNSNIQNNMIKIYNEFKNFNYFFVVLYPIFIIAIIITNIYTLFNGLLLFRNKTTNEKEWRTKIKDIVFIFVTSSFIGVIYLYDNNLSFIEATDLEFIYYNLDIIKILLTAIFIPTLFEKAIRKPKISKLIQFENSE